MPKLFDLMFTFFRLGLFTFGGGYAMLPLLEREVVEKKSWASKEQLLDYYALGQSTPGIIAVNTATFIGYFQGGLLGSLIATFGLVLPSLIIIIIVAAVLNQYMELALWQHAFAGIRVAVCALVSFSVWRLAKVGVVDLFTFLWLMLTFSSIAFFNLSPLWIVTASFVVGNLRGARREGRL